MYIVVSNIVINLGFPHSYHLQHFMYISEPKKYKMVSKILPFIFYSLHSGIENNKKNNFLTYFASFVYNRTQKVLNGTKNSTIHILLII